MQSFPHTIRIKLWMLVFIHLILLSFFAGYFLRDELSFDPLLQMKKSSTQTPWFHFFLKNILFFTIVALTPFFNLILVTPALVHVGLSASLIASKPWALQSKLLFRHFWFELMALGCAFYLSYQLYYAMKAYIEQEKLDVYLVRKRTIVLAALVLFCTLIGAFLEGSVGELLI